MLFRFAAAVSLVVTIALLGIAVEKRNLALRRAITLQHYREERLTERAARLRLRTQQLGAPARLLDALQAQGERTQQPHRN